MGDGLRLRREHCGRVHSLGRSLARLRRAEEDLGHLDQLHDRLWQVELGDLRHHALDLHGHPLVSVPVRRDAVFQVVPPALPHQPLDLARVAPQPLLGGHARLRHGEVRDIYRMEFEVFQSLGWVCFYLASVVIFSTHMCLGWQKVVPAPSLDIPKRYHSKAIHVGYVMTAFIALIYASFPLYTHIFPMSDGAISPEVPLP